MSASNKILVVEDDEQLLRMLHFTLLQAGYDVTTAKSGKAALAALGEQEFGATLLDLGLPDMDGKDVIADAQALSHTPVLVISARDSEKEKIAALDMGADDYIAKPFDTGELLARIRVALRPPRQGAPAVAEGANNLTIDFDTRRAFVNGAPVRLSQKETQLLRLLADAKGAVVPYEQIVEAIWGPGVDSAYMNVRVLAWQVRRKIEPDAGAPRFLIAEAGKGYRLKLD